MVHDESPQEAKTVSHPVQCSPFSSNKPYKNGKVTWRNKMGCTSYMVGGVFKKDIKKTISSDRNGNEHVRVHKMLGSQVWRKVTFEIWRHKSTICFEEDWHLLQDSDYIFLRCLSLNEIYPVYRKFFLYFVLYILRQDKKSKIRLDIYWNCFSNTIDFIL